MPSSTERSPAVSDRADSIFKKSDGRNVGIFRLRNRIPRNAHRKWGSVFLITRGRTHRFYEPLQNVAVCIRVEKTSRLIERTPPVLVRLHGQSRNISTGKLFFSDTKYKMAATIFHDRHLYALAQHTRLSTDRRYSPTFLIG